MAANPKPISAERLDSWKQIAAFFDRAERTVKRWETERGLPIHRVPGGGRGAVFAYPSELTDWLKGRTQELEADEPHSTKPEPATPVAEIPQIEAASPPLATPTTVPVPKNLTAIRFAAWLVPLALAGGLILYFSLGHGGLRFKVAASRHVPNAEAQDLYLKGRFFWNRRTPDDLNKAVDYFTQAIVKDPSDADAYVGLSDSYNLLREFGAMPPNEAFPRALAAAQRAIELDDTSAEAHNSLAFVSFWWSWQAVTAEREFKRAIELNPNLVRAHHWYATYLMGLHRYAEALEQMEQAQRLDPSSTAILADKGLLLAEAGHKTEAFALLAQLETVQPTFSSVHDYLGRIYWEQEDYPRALAEWRRLAELRHDGAGLTIVAAAERGYAADGRRGMLTAELPLAKELADRNSGSAYAVAQTYAVLGDKKQAFRYLQLSFDRREAAMATEAPIPELQNDPRYQKLRSEVNQQLAR